jgi:hypothetical protein
MQTALSGPFDKQTTQRDVHDAIGRWRSGLARRHARSAITITASLNHAASTALDVYADVATRGCEAAVIAMNVSSTSSARMSEPLLGRAWRAMS